MLQSQNPRVLLRPHNYDFVVLLCSFLKQNKLNTKGASIYYVDSQGGGGFIICQRSSTRSRGGAIGLSTFIANLGYSCWLLIWYEIRIFLFIYYLIDKISHDFF